MDKNNWDEFTKRLSSYGMGVANAPIDLVKYAGLGANELAERVGILSKQESIRRANAINQVMTELPFLPKSVVDYRNWLKSGNPEMFEIGEVAGASLGAGVFSKTPYGMKTLVNPVTAGALATLGIIKEEKLEPKLEELSKK